MEIIKTPVGFFFFLKKVSVVVVEDNISKLLIKKK